MTSVCEQVLARRSKEEEEASTTQPGTRCVCKHCFGKETLIIIFVNQLVAVCLSFVFIVHCVCVEYAQTYIFKFTYLPVRHNNIIV